MSLTVGLVQINNTIFGRRYLPYAVGLLQAYAQRHFSAPETLRFLSPVFKREPVAEIVERLRGADVVGFSCYMWSMQLSLAVARALHEQRPETLIVFGGPQVPEASEAFLRANPFIDVCVHGEGERAFCALLEAPARGGWAHIPGVSFLEAGAYHASPRGPRMRDLDEAPSPYLSDTFAPLIEAHPEQAWLACWETNRGCPFSCTFCDWGSAVASKVSGFELERVKAEVDWFAAHKVEFVFCCDANFGILPRDVEIAGHLAQVRQRTGYPVEISVQNTKNATERAYEVQALLSKAGLNKEVALSLQSVDPHTLKQIRRSNIALEHFEELQRRFAADGVPTYTDLVLGLPGETVDSFTRGVERIISSGQLGRIKFYSLTLLPNSEVAHPEQRALHGLQTAVCRLINIHGPMGEQAEVHEHQEVVIGTATMPPEDWAFVRAFAWLTELVFYGKLLQMPMQLLQIKAGVGYRDQLLALMRARAAQAPSLTRIVSFFMEKARDIQRGGVEHCESSLWPGTWWPADNYALIQLQSSGQLGAFYDDCGATLRALARDSAAANAEALCDAALQLNRLLLPGLRA